MALVAAGCAALLLSGLDVLTGGVAWEVSVHALTPGGAWVFGMDALSAFFVVAIALVGGATAVYGAGYVGRGARPGPAALSHAAVALLLVALALVVTARAVVPFLIAWELMAVLAFLLVMYEHQHESTRRAGLIYLVATHTATLALIMLFAWWGASAGDLTFAALARAAAGSDFPRDGLLLLALLGFGLKAGLVPLHFWLPGAHAAAPTHGSALLSGLVLKSGIYGLLRVAALLAGLPEWFGWVLLALGVVSGVLGVVWALAQHDIKRLLAYHSVENIGLILMGMGVGALGSVYGLPAVAALGYAGAILHVLNHALFKGLLFLGAGCVAHGAGTRDLDRLGGLARRMPATGTLFLVASAAIVGLPPLNGFVSEWTIARALFGAGLGQGAIRGALAGLGALGLIGGLALACFAKVNGVVFLGHPRSPGAAEAHEVGPPLLAPMTALALACVFIGLLPQLALPMAMSAAEVVAGPGAVGVIAGHDAVWLGRLGLLLVAVLGVGWLVWRGLMRGRSRIVARTWGCGYPLVTPRMQYTASSFAAPVLEPFGRVAGLHAETTAGAFVTHPTDPGLDGLLLPAWRRLRLLTLRMRALHVGRLHVYLLYVLATVLLLLGYLAAWPIR